MIRLPTSPTLFPYTTLFRSRQRPQVRILSGAPGLTARDPDKLDADPAGRPAQPDTLPRSAGIEHDHLFALRRDVNDRDRKSTRLNSSHGYISYAVFCLQKKK